MKSIRVSYDRQEVRRDRRYPMPPIGVIIEVAEYTTVNWSLGGFLLGGYTGPAKPGDQITGRLRVTEKIDPVPFTGVVVRVGEPGKETLAVQFSGLDDRVMTLLEKAIMRRLFRVRSGSELS